MREAARGRRLALGAVQGGCGRLGALQELRVGGREGADGEEVAGSGAGSGAGAGAGAGAEAAFGAERPNMPIPDFFLFFFRFVGFLKFILGLNSVLGTVAAGAGAGAGAGALVGGSWTPPKLKPPPRDASSVGSAPKLKPEASSVAASPASSAPKEKPVPASSAAVGKRLWQSKYWIIGRANRHVNILSCCVLPIV